MLTGWLSDYLVPPDDAAVLADRLGALRGWRTTDPHLGERCREAAESRLSLEDEVDLIEEAMRESGDRAR